VPLDPPRARTDWSCICTPTAGWRRGWTGRRGCRETASCSGRRWPASYTRAGTGRTPCPTRRPAGRRADLVIAEGQVDGEQGDVRSLLL